MLDKEEFEKGGKTSAQIIDEAIKGPLLDDFRKEMDRRILADIIGLARPIITNAPITYIPINIKQHDQSK